MVSGLPTLYRGGILIVTDHRLCTAAIYGRAASGRLFNLCNTIAAELVGLKYCVEAADFRSN